MFVKTIQSCYVCTQFKGCEIKTEASHLKTVFMKNWMLRVPFSKLETKQQQFERVVKLKHFILFGSPPPTCVFRECVLVLLPVGDPLQVFVLLPVGDPLQVCVLLHVGDPSKCASTFLLATPSKCASSFLLATPSKCAPFFLCASSSMFAFPWIFHPPIQEKLNPSLAYYPKVKLSLKF